MKQCPWEEIHGFQSPEEFEQFEKWMKEQIEIGNSEEIVSKIQPVNQYILTKERWFKYIPSCEFWRLEDPDPPFYGTFEPFNE